MSLLNYTTTVEAAKTVMEIQGILVKHGARSLLLDYLKDGSIGALTFSVPTTRGDLSFKLPVNTEAVFKVLQKRHPNIAFHSITTAKDRAQAARVAWRIIKDWVEAQMALIELGMVKLEEVFLPYALLPSGETYFQALERSGFKMLGMLGAG
ncbi:MAG: hypothetical protein Q8O55_08720 [Dehalococcoidales bacterium]|nr:hypothetical protein [Dehalococcoidales bacterium]